LWDRTRSGRGGLEPKNKALVLHLYTRPQQENISYVEPELTELRESACVETPFRSCLNLKIYLQREFQPGTESEMVDTTMYHEDFMPSSQDRPLLPP
jgi:hypothetical protein